MLLEIISQSSAQEIKEGVITEQVIDLFRVGDRQFVFPNIIWHKNKTYFAGDKGNTNFNNQIQLFQYDHNKELFTYIDVGSGTDITDAFNHPVTWIWEENDYIYAGQTNTHNDPIEVYKSKSKNDINNGLELVGSILGANGYPQVFKSVDGKICFCARDFKGGLRFDLAFQKSDSGIEGNFTQTLVTEDTLDTPDNVRYYNSTAIQYGTPTKNYLLACLRNDTLQTYFATALFVTTDLITVSNYQQTASQDLSIAQVNSIEVENNYTINGSTGNITENLGFTNSITINDDWHGITVKSGTTRHYIFSVIGTVLTDTLLDIDNVHVGFFAPTMWYNGNNIVISLIRFVNGNYTKELWATPLDLSFFTQKYVYDEGATTNGRLIKLPDNLDKVQGQYAMYVDDNESGGNLMLDLTSNKWIV